MPAPHVDGMVAFSDSPGIEIANSFVPEKSPMPIFVTSLMVNQKRTMFRIKRMIMSMVRIQDIFGYFLRMNGKSIINAEVTMSSMLRTDKTVVKTSGTSLISPPITVSVSVRVIKVGG